MKILYKNKNSATMPNRMIFDDDTINKIINLYKGGLDSHKIGKELGISCQPILRILRENNIQLRNKYIDLIPAEIINLYVNENKTLVEISKMFKTSPGRVCKLLKEYNIKVDIRKHIFDENFFENIDSEIKAYWFGFLYADGNIDKNIYRCDLLLSIVDIDHLLKFKKAIKYKEDIKFKINKNKKYCHLTLNSHKLCTNLYNHGCVSNKSLVIKFPELRQDLIRHFIRGYFDGNGCISIHKQGIGLVFVSGSIEFLESINNILHNECNSEFVNIHNKENYGKLLWTSFDDIIKIYHYLYNNSNISLDQKYEKFQRLINDKEKIFDEINQYRREYYKSIKDKLNIKRREIHNNIKDEKNLKRREQYKLKHSKNQIQ